MAIIYSYSTISSLDDDDLMVITDTSMDNLPTRSVKLSTLKGFFLSGSSGSYVLPIASSIVLGGVKIGSGITVGVDGTISTATGDITAVLPGTYINIDNSTGPEPTVNHDLTTRPVDTNNGDASPGYGGTFTMIDSVTTNSTGHVTLANLKTITLPASDNTDNYVDSLGFNTASGVLTLGRTGALPDLTQNLDGRYGLINNQTVTLTGDVTGSGTTSITTIISAGAVDFAMVNPAAVITESEGIGNNDNDTTWPTTAAVKDYVDSSVVNTTMNTLSGDLTLAQGTGISITNNGVDTITVTNTFTDSPLELINEGNGDGIVLAGRTASNYGNVGDKAVDLSHSNQSSATYGATAVYSFASGYLATASGPYSVSFSGTATGFGSLALGRESQATASNAVALGPLSLATSISDLAIGTGATASGGGSIAVGNADSTATYTVAIGSSASASGDFAVAIGHQADSTANYAMGLGYNAKADGVQSAAIGKDSSATHTAAMALGSGAITSADYQIALGSASASVAVKISSLPNTSSYADDAAAATGGVLVGELYRTDSIVKIRIS